MGAFSAAGLFGEEGDGGDWKGCCGGGGGEDDEEGGALWGEEFWKERAAAAGAGGGVHEGMGCSQLPRRYDSLFTPRSISGCASLFCSLCSQGSSRGC